MRVKKLCWATVRIGHAGRTVLIDPLLSFGALTELGLGAPRHPEVPLESQTADAVLVTHSHPDHLDPEAIRHVLSPGGSVFCPEALVGRLVGLGFPARSTALFEPFISGQLTITPVPAVDGLGDVQVSWVVDDGSRRVIHLGDTLWHGYWWSIRRKIGSCDLACVPINGAVVEFAGMEASGLPACITPEQAAVAARLLGARRAIPIHYATFHNPPTYVEQPKALERFRRSCALEEVEPLVRADGETVEL